MVHSMAVRLLPSAPSYVRCIEIGSGVVRCTTTQSVERAFGSDKITGDCSGCQLQAIDLWLECLHVSEIALSCSWNEFRRIVFSSDTRNL